VLEIRIEADLALGRHSEVVAELRRAAEADPYRQRLVAQLMVALYRSGRHTEALDAYERTRRALDSDLGLRPSEELQRLAGQIVRQEPDLRAPAPTLDAADERRTSRRRRAFASAAGAVLAAVATALAFVIASDEVVSGGSPARVALIRMWNPHGPGGYDEAGWQPFVDGLLAAERRYGIEAEIIDLFSHRPPLGGDQPGSPEDVERLSERLRVGDFDLVLWPLGLTGPNFYAAVPENRHTQFAFLDFCCVGDVLAGSPNTTTITLRADRASHLAGYLSGLMAARRSPATNRQHTVSIILGEPDFPQEHAWEQGFLAGARRALPDVTVLTAYSHEWDDQAICESLANRQIDAGSVVVFAAAGDCGIGALSAAGIRGVWGDATAGDRADLGPHIHASATKRFERLTELSVGWYLEGRLPAGRDIALGLADDAVALVGINPDVPLGIRSKVAHEAARLRSQDAALRSS
jgi:basic membrane lipoprotein Med (substrate-binding protein (PBP1-ABC) superfamily)